MKIFANYVGREFLNLLWKFMMMLTGKESSENFLKRRREGG